MELGERQSIEDELRRLHTQVSQLRSKEDVGELRYGQPLTEMAALTARVAAIEAGSQWAIDSVYTSLSPTNPATILGFGTWIAFGAGRVLVGIDATDTDFDTVEETQGAKTATPSAHTGAGVNSNASGTAATEHDTDKGFHDHDNHTASTTYDTAGVTAAFNGPVRHSDDGAHGHDEHSTHGHTAEQATAHAALSVVQPSIVVYFWRRTA